MHLNLIDQDEQALAELEARIEEAMAPLAAARELLVSIPGISTTVAEVLLAGTGADTSVFPTAGHLASWAGRPRIQRISRQGEVHQDQTRQPVPQRCARDRDAGRDPVEEHLLLRDIQTHRIAAGTHESARLCGQFDADRNLAHAQQL
jgi:hypothetical protein